MARLYSGTVEKKAVVSHFDKLSDRNHCHYVSFQTALRLERISPLIIAETTYGETFFLPPIVSAVHTRVIVVEDAV